jgi:hypothetical protein
MRVFSFIVVEYTQYETERGGQPVTVALPRYVKDIFAARMFWVQPFDDRGEDTKEKSRLDGVFAHIWLRVQGLR